jgi:glycosyltransferase involved in cell wall biosynthesis
VTPDTGLTPPTDAASPPALSLLVPTRNRAALLPRLLRSLEAALTDEVEVLIVDNGSTDNTAAVLAAWIAGGPRRARYYVAEPGRGRALNQALSRVHAPLVAFTDDDVEVAPDWLRVGVAFFAAHPEYDGAMGPVRVPPTLTDPALLARVRAYPDVLPLFEGGEHVRDLDILYGCNMIVRRAVFERVGTFNEQLGVGASGLAEDTEFADRMRQAGMRIGYIPNAIVYHDVDLQRLTFNAFVAFHVRLARSLFLIHPERFGEANFGKMVDAAASVVRWRLRGERARWLHAYARMIRHREFLRLRWARWRNTRGARRASARAQ